MFLKKIQKTFIFRLTFTHSYGIIHNGFVLRLVANPMCGVCWRVRFYPNSKHRLGSSPRVKIEGAQKQVWRNGRRAGFRFQWRDSCGFKSRHLHQIRTQNRIQEIVPNLRFLLLFRGIFALLRLNFIVCDKMSLSFGGVCAFQWIGSFCFR